MQTLLTLLMVLHFAVHLGAVIGIPLSLMHSHTKHKPSVWKIIFAVLWLVISIITLLTIHPEHC
jgi:hypothetical protein